MGYYAPGADPASLDEAMRELPEMRGRFQKPQFIAFRETAASMAGRVPATAADVLRSAPSARSNPRIETFPSITTSARGAAAAPWSARRTQSAWFSRLRKSC